MTYYDHIEYAKINNTKLLQNVRGKKGSKSGRTIESAKFVIAKLNHTIRINIYVRKSRPEVPLYNFYIFTAKNIRITENQVYYHMTYITFHNTASQFPHDVLKIPVM